MTMILSITAEHVKMCDMANGELAISLQQEHGDLWTFLKVSDTLVPLGRTVAALVPAEERAVLVALTAGGEGNPGIPGFTTSVFLVAILQSRGDNGYVGRFPFLKKNCTCAISS